MNWADYAILGVLILSALLGMSRGLVREALALGVWIAALLVASIFSPTLAEQITDVISTPSLRQLAAFAILFVLSMIVGTLIQRLLGELVRAAGLGGIDRVLGMAFGLARGVIIMLLVLVFLPSVLDVTGDPWWHQSLLIPELLQLEGLGREIVAWLGELFSSAKA